MKCSTKIENVSNFVVRKEKYKERYLKNAAATASGSSGSPEAKYQLMSLLDSIHNS